MAVNPMDYSSKDVVLDVVRTERAKFYEIIDDPANWNVQSCCTEWEVRDIVGHMIDVNEGYLTRWDMARRGKMPEALGLRVMAESLNRNAKAFRSLPREEAIARLKTSSDTLLAILDSLTADEWNNFLVPHVYMGPLPTLFYPAFQIMDYGVHTWDMRWGLGEKEGKLDERTAGVLTPYMFILMQATLDEKEATGFNTQFGIEVDGEWGGKWLVTVQDGQLSHNPVDDLSNAPAVFHFKDASSFVLTTFQRFPGGEASGDPKVIDRVRRLFFKI